MPQAHEMRILVTGVDAAGKSCVVNDGRVVLDSSSPSPVLWMAVAFATSEVPPPARPPGHGGGFAMGIDPGITQWLVVDYAPSESFPVHHTDTLDFDVVLDGSVELVLDDGAHLLRPGEGAVVTGVDHGWRAGPDGCRLSIIVVGTPPPPA